ncbi:Uncharacterised protein g4085 [Pycnogonum litorale]
MDIVTRLIGHFGRFHFGLYLLLCSLGFCLAVVILPMTFFAPRDLDYWCARPDNLKNMSVDEWKNVTSVTEVKGGIEVISKCMMSNLSQMSDGEFTNRSLSEATPGVVQCTSWEYDPSFYADTLIEKWDLVCDSEVLISTANFLGLLGLLFGAFFTGQISDRYGRRPTVLGCLVVTIIAGYCTIICTYYVVFVILRFITLGTTIGSFTVCFVLFSECTDDRGRATWGIAKGMGFAVGFMILAALGYLIRSWFYLQATIMTPFVIALFVMYFFLPESPRWLLVNGKVTECAEVIERIITVNKVNEPIGKELTDLLNDAHSEILHGTTLKKTNVLDLVKTPKLRWMSLNMFFVWFATAFVYYVESFNSGDLGGDKFVNFFVSGAVEVPAILIVALFVFKLGRRKPLIVFSLIAAAGCFLTMSAPDDMPGLRVGFAMVAKFAMSANFVLIYVYASEIFPTPVRNIGVGTSSTVARIGTALAPYANEIGLVTNKHVPQGICGAIALICCICAFFLPETAHKKFPETIEDVENGCLETKPAMKNENVPEKE